MDPQLEALKREVEKSAALAADTNRMVHKMRRGQRWRMLFSIVWWLLIAAASGAAYYYYVQPYVEALMGAYGNAQDFQLQIQDFFAQFGQRR